MAVGTQFETHCLKKKKKSIFSNPSGQNILRIMIIRITIVANLHHAYNMPGAALSTVYINCSDSNHHIVR